MLCFDGERVGSPPFESLARQKHCYYEKGGGEGVASHSDTVVPAQIQNNGSVRSAGNMGDTPPRRADSEDFVSFCKTYHPSTGTSIGNLDSMCAL